MNKILFINRMGVSKLIKKFIVLYQIFLTFEKKSEWRIQLA